MRASHVVTAALLLRILGGCQSPQGPDDPPPPPPPPPPVALSSVAIVPAQYDLLVGEEVALAAQANGYDCSSLACVPGGPVVVPFTWSSSVAGVLSIQATGVTRGIAPGVSNAIASYAGIARNTARIRVATAFVALGSVAASEYQTCGLAADGSAYCWPERPARYDPIQLPDAGIIPAAPFAGGLRFSQISLGSNHGCGITVAGPTVCWGTNGLGRSDLNNPAPGEITGGHRFTLLSANSGFKNLGGQPIDHTCGVDGAGLAWCWGDNMYGQIGTAAALPPRIGFGGTPHAPQPTAVDGGRIFREVAAGWRHSCGVTTAGTVFCWGANDAGQLGDGSTTNSLTPVQAVLGGEVADLAAGVDYTCARRPAGEVLCWGNNAQGQLGLGTRDAVPHPLPAGVVGGTAFTKVSAGFLTCGLDGSGRSWCWGWTTEPIPTLVPVETGLIALAVGWNHACAIRPAGRAVCWGGNNSYHQLGSLGPFTSVPRPIAGPIAP